MSVAVLEPPDVLAALTGHDIGPIIRALMRDRSYQQHTGLGPTIRRYLRHKQVEEGAAAETLRTREIVLRQLAVYHSDRTLQDFDGRAGTTMLRDAIADLWGALADNSRRTYTSALRDFFDWCYREGLLDFDPARVLKAPRQRGTSRRAHDRAELSKLVRSQSWVNDRLALSILYGAALRRSELRKLQLGAIDFAIPAVTVIGKGSKEGTVPLFPALAEELERYVQERSLLNPRGFREEYLLFWRKVGRRGAWPVYAVDVIAEDRCRPLSDSGIAKWWDRCLDRADLPHFPMHELRHTAGTAFQIEKGDYELTRQFLRHEHISTTATYIHVPNPHLRRAVREMPDWREPPGEESA